MKFVLLFCVLFYLFGFSSFVDADDSAQCSIGCYENNKKSNFKLDFSGVVLSSDDLGKQSISLGEWVTSPDFCHFCPSLDSSVILGSPVVYFESGGRGDRSIRVYGESDFDVVSFILAAPNVRAGVSHSAKGRVQLDVYNNVGTKHIKAAVSMRLGQGFALIGGYRPAVNWLTISEWWNNASWTGEEHPFRLSVNLVKFRDQEELRFAVRAESFNSDSKVWGAPSWFYVNRHIQVPIGKWVRLEYELVEGDAYNGLFRLNMEVDGILHNVFHEINFTKHPDAIEGDGFRHFSPIKLYTSGHLLNYFKGKGVPIMIDWKGLEVEVFRY